STAGIPSATDKQRTLYRTHAEALKRANPDFQTERTYPEPKPGEANMTMCGNWTAETFGCLASTLEMPFKDTAETPDAHAGWSPERSRKLGAAELDAVAAVIGDLR